MANRVEKIETLEPTNQLTLMVYEYIRNEQGHFVCPRCKQVEVNQNTMHYHMKRHEGQLPFQCNICKKEFLYQSSLDFHHLSKHCEDNEKQKAQKFKCPVPNCPFQDMRKGNVRIHFLRIHCIEDIQRILQHTNEKFCCTACKKPFQSSTAFHYHAASCISIQDKAKRDMLDTLVSVA